MVTSNDKSTRKDFDKYGTRIVNMTVKAKDGAMVYDSTGAPIPGDNFVTVPISATLVRAVQNGDLEEMEEAKPAPTRTTSKKTSESESLSKSTTTKTSE
jgi:hypothetical protein